MKNYINEENNNNSNIFLFLCNLDIYVKIQSMFLMCHILMVKKLYSSTNVLYCKIIINFLFPLKDVQKSEKIASKSPQKYTGW